MSCKGSGRTNVNANLYFSNHECFAQHVRLNIKMRTRPQERSDKNAESKQTAH